VPLPLTPPFAPQLAKARTALPEGPGWVYEPKWDGFRAVAFVDGDALTLLSRGGKDLVRYFPEVRLPPGRYVLDGELVVDADATVRAATGRDDGPTSTDEVDFDALSQRIHPAQSRIDRLSVELPARYVAFDLLAEEDEVLLERPLRERRAALEALLERLDTDAATLALTPQVSDPADARGWLQDIEGVVAKEADAPYAPGARRGMAKIKRRRTTDCVVIGWREGKQAGTVGSLILGLYGPDGELRHVGHTSGLKAAEKREWADELAPLATGATGGGEPSRWRSASDAAWTEVRPELVVEVSYDQVTAGRIRHGARLERRRDDKRPAECTIDQLDPAA